ncbi:MAG: pyruvate ferredoxin oxidoreductase [Candidatus Diapherotrites archaeon]|uniref:pyruvate synthase n=1 Tax=Candidatus Iainarchaeum sp. TaxID=3101447 RepID=A0A2D6LNW0_9ARCH|nr:pyruvate ferredoxin oxidoreductase [Candidatus Diapherotrites archaeon]|tara:strand:+ start:17195 stop:17758 length:564 start_codon:yes stop_codon:yes gene_type:complete
MIEIRLHARAGQGMVTGAELIALAANYEGKSSQAFPFFGSEKRGPPVEAYARIADKPIMIHEEISEPDYVIVGDASILDSVDVCAGLKEDGIVIINSDKKPGELGLKAKRVFTVDATEVALKHFKKLILNTVMLGAFCKVTGVVKLESVKRAIKEKLGEKFSEKIIEANINAIQEIYDTMEVEKVKV